MSENKNERKTVWMYAVILFTSAFIVLLLTAYSQIKINKNIDNYKNQITNEEKAKKGFQTNLNATLQENKRLQDEIAALKDELGKNKVEKEEITAKEKELDNKFLKVLDNYNVLIKAENLYIEGKMIDCAVTLNSNCNPEYLTKEGLEKYNFLLDKTRKKAAEQLFFEGIKRYKNKDYNESVKNLNLSIELEKNEYFSDDCIYYIAYSEYRQGNKELANDAIDELVNKYPGSNYIVDAKNLKNRLK